MPTAGNFDSTATPRSFVFGSPPPPPRPPPPARAPRAPPAARPPARERPGGPRAHHVREHLVPRAERAHDPPNTLGVRPPRHRVLLRGPAGDRPRDAGRCRGRPAAGNARRRAGEGEAAPAPPARLRPGDPPGRVLRRDRVPMVPRSEPPRRLPPDSPGDGELPPRLRDLRDRPPPPDGRQARDPGHRSVPERQRRGGGRPRRVRLRVLRPRLAPALRAVYGQPPRLGGRVLLRIPPPVVGRPAGKTSLTRGALSVRSHGGRVPRPLGRPHGLRRDGGRVPPAAVGDPPLPLRRLPRGVAPRPRRRVRLVLGAHGEAGAEDL